MSAEPVTDELVAAAERIARDPRARNRVRLLTVACPADHVLGWVLPVHRRRVLAGRLAGEGLGFVADVDNEGLATTLWGSPLTCPCGRVWIDPAWLMGVLDGGARRAIVPTAPRRVRYRTLPSLRRKAEARDGG